MKAMVMFIEKKHRHFFLNDPITKNKKAKQNVILQLRQFLIFFHRNFRD